MSKLHRYSRLVVKEGSPLVIHDKKHKLSYIIRKVGNRRIVYKVNKDDTLTMIKKPTWLHLPKPKKTKKKAKPKPKPKKKPVKKRKLLSDVELMNLYMKMGIVPPVLPDEHMEPPVIYHAPLPHVEAEPEEAPTEAPFEAVPLKSTTPQHIEHIKQFGSVKARRILGTFEKYWKHYKEALKRARKKKDKEAIKEYKAKVVEYQKKIASLVGTGKYGGFADLNTGFVKTGGRIDPEDDLFPIEHLYQFTPYRPYPPLPIYPQIQ